MLRPTKHSNPDRTVLFLSMLLLQRIKKQRIESYDDLLALAKSKVKGGGVLFVQSLNLLFLFGLIAYHSKTDSLEYVGPNEAI